MKKIILLALTALMMAGCKYKTTAEIEEARRLHGFNIIIVDSCEYLKSKEGNGYLGFGFLLIKATAASVRSVGRRK